MHALVLVLLVATPLDVIVVRGPGVKASLTKELKGSTIVDATSVHSYLFASNLLGMQDYSTFTAAPIAGWPVPLAGVWKTNIAFCGKIAGPPPYRDTMPAVMVCAQRLSKLLWQKYLDHHAPRQVYELSANVSEKKGKASVQGSTYEPNGADAVGASEETTPNDVGAAIDRIAADLIAKKGTSAPREIISEMSTRSVGDPLAGDAVATAPVELKKTCDAMPKTLTFATPSVLGQSVAAQWAAASKGTAAPRACTLDVTSREEDVMGGRVTVLIAMLECGDQQASAEAARLGKGAKKGPADILSPRLVTALAGRFCK